jgi:hypothetical protein
MVVVKVLGSGWVDPDRVVVVVVVVVVKGRGRVVVSEVFG